MQTTVFQQSLASSVRMDGVGMHSGAVTALTLGPAPANTGIVFVRSDIMDRDNVVPARWDHVVDTQLCTVIANRAGVRVSTVEHLMAALAACGIDNAAVRVDGPEVPILDGSAAEFIAAIDRAGRQRQSAPRRALRVRRTVSCQEGGKEVFLSPADGAYFGCEIDFDTPAIGFQKYLHPFGEAAFRRDIARARTFGFLHEVEQLRRMGLARGGSLENAVVFDGDRVLNPGGLRFANECVRHKILDAVGDIYLAGMPLIGHYHGVRAGHAMNNKVLRALFAQQDAWEIVTMTAPAQAGHSGSYAGQGQAVAAVA